MDNESTFTQSQNQTNSFAEKPNLITPNHIAKRSRTTSSGVLTTIIICTILSLIGIGMGIYSVIQINHINQELRENGIELVSEPDNESAKNEEDYKCVTPTSVQDIFSIYLNQLNSEAYTVVNSGNQITYYTTVTDENGVVNEIEKTIDRDTSDIFQYVIDNDLGYLGNSYNSEDNTGDIITWTLRVETTDGNYCMAYGADTEPEWFMNLVNLVNSKQNQ